MLAFAPLSFSVSSPPALPPEWTKRPKQSAAAMSGQTRRAPASACRVANTAPFGHVPLQLRQHIPRRCKAAGARSSARHGPTNRLRSGRTRFPDFTRVRRCCCQKLLRRRRWWLVGRVRREWQMPAAVGALPAQRVDQAAAWRRRGARVRPAAEVDGYEGVERLGFAFFAALGQLVQPGVEVVGQCRVQGLYVEVSLSPACVSVCIRVYAFSCTSIDWTT